MIYTQLSDWTLTSKPTDPREKARISGKQHFHNREMTEEAFYEALQEGHGFCPLSRDQAKTDQARTNIIVYDFDHCTTPLDEFIKGLTIKPTYTYYSFSNGKDGQYRYRLIFQLSECITGSQYDEVHQHIAQANGWMPASKGDGDNLNTYDPLARNQYFFSGTSISYYPNNIINIINEYTHTQPKPAQPREHHQPAPKPAPTAKKAKKARQDGDEYTQYKYFSDSFVAKICEYIPSPYAIRFNYITHTPLPEVDADTPIILYPKDYLETPRKFAYDPLKKSYGIAKYRDGENRHKKLFITGIILRRLNPDLTPIHLLKALLREFTLYYDNTDGKYTMPRLLAIADAVLDADITIELKRWRKPKYIVNPKYCAKHLVTKRQVVGQQNGIRQAEERAKRYEAISKYYDPAKSDAANLLTLHNAGIKCSKNTLTAFKYLYGYTQGREQATPQGSTQQQQPMKPDIADSVKKMLRGGLNN